MSENNSKPIKALAELSNLKGGGKNIFSLSGVCIHSNMVAHENCLYGLRVDYTQNFMK